MSTPRQQNLDRFFPSWDPGRVPETQDPPAFPLAHASQVTAEWDRARHTAEPQGQPPARDATGSDRRTWWRAGVVAGGLIASGALLFHATTPGAGDTVAVNATETTLPELTDAVTAAAPASGDDTVCPTRTDGDLVRGNGPGGTDSGSDAVLAFQYAYYVARSGAQARAVTTPEAAVPAAQEIQQGIDSIPLGTTHCLAIAALPQGRFAVELTEHRPDGSSSLERQTVSTVTRDRRVLITGITAR